MLYFAYGSCMNKADLHRTTPDATLISTAIVPNYKLDYSINSINRAGGVADIIPAEGHKVEGILWDVPDFSTLDKREQSPYTYEQTPIILQTPTGEVEAITYTAVFKDTPVKPSPEYLQLLLTPALPLSANYLYELEAYANSLTWEAKTIPDWILTYWDLDMKPNQEYFFNPQEAMDRFMYYLMSQRPVQFNHRLDPERPNNN